MTAPHSHPDVRVLWGKWGLDKASVAVHPLICHMLDVGAVAEATWRDVLPAPARSAIAAVLQVDEDDAQRWLALLAAAHDLGKCSPSFQVQRPEIMQVLESAGFPCLLGAPPARHEIVTTATLPALLVADLGFSNALARRVSTVVGGHHGVFPSGRDVDDVTVGKAIGRGAWVTARRGLICGLARLLDVPSSAPTGQLDNSAAMLVAGFVSVADWIGSNERWFPYARPDYRIVGDTDDLADYLEQSRARARRALDELAWAVPTPAVAHPSFEELHGKAPRPMQAATVDLAARLAGPGLVLMEVPTGEGKTEAALTLADRWAADLGTRGFYIAMPTMASSNQLFTRARQFLARRYPRGRAGLQLQHGHAALSTELAELQAAADMWADLANIYGAGSGRTPPDVVAASWFAQSKRGLLTPFGVGTVDQALLAALQVRHGFVRLFGLAHRTIVLDEVHAYDTYMSTLMERLLEWLAALGAPVVLLSATLPNARRAALIEAYARGAGWPMPEATSPAYPRLSWVSAGGAGGQTVEVSATATKTVRLRWVDGDVPPDSDTPFPLGEQLRGALSDGGCAAVICNTVAAAQGMFMALKPYFPGTADDGLPVLDLLHARFLFGDREQREKRLLRRFGPPSPETRRPQRAVLVATQVIELSLDLDFDLMVSEPAPVDLLLQRAGRLHRHAQPQERPRDLRLASLWLLQPRAGADGVPHFGWGTEAVYEPHVLLRSWLALRDRTVVQVPTDVDALIEAAYDGRACPDDLDDALRETWDTTSQELVKAWEGDAHEAEIRRLGTVNYSGALWQLTRDTREEDDPEVHQALRAVTRWGPPTVQVVCADAAGSRRIALGQKPSRPRVEQLLRRSVPIARKGLAEALLATPVPPAWKRSPLLCHHRLLELDGRNCATVGKHLLRLDDELGVVIDTLTLGGA